MKDQSNEHQKELASTPWDFFRGWILQKRWTGISFSLGVQRRVHGVKSTGQSEHEHSCKIYHAYMCILRTYQGQASGWTSRNRKERVSMVMRSTKKTCISKNWCGMSWRRQGHGMSCSLCIIFFNFLAPRIVIVSYTHEEVNSSLWGNLWLRKGAGLLMSSFYNMSFVLYLTVFFF